MSETPRQSGPVTLATLRKRVSGGQKIPVLTCYDATTARWLSRGGVDVLLVGDTAAEMILGEASTIHAPLDFLVTITAAVKRGAPGSFVIADMPFLSYHLSGDEAVKNAGRFLLEAHADVVKLEVDSSHAELVQRMSRAGIPVMAHVGSRPQQVQRQGGYRSAGKTAAEGRSLVEQAELMEAMGAVMLLVEATTAEVSERMVSRVKIPVIGCGAGPACHGHVVVLHDLLGLTEWQPPFAEPRAKMGEAIASAAAEWAELVRENRYLVKDHPYHMAAGEGEKFARE